METDTVRRHLGFSFDINTLLGSLVTFSPQVREYTSRYFKSQISYIHYWVWGLKKREKSSSGLKTWNYSVLGRNVAMGKEIPLLLLIQINIHVCVEICRGNRDAFLKWSFGVIWFIADSLDSTHITPPHQTSLHSVQIYSFLYHLECTDFKQLS